eukprot:8732261-Alexandrium_andersonii.AAC.1
MHPRTRQQSEAHNCHFLWATAVTKALPAPRPNCGCAQSIEQATAAPGNGDTHNQAKTKWGPRAHSPQ